MGQSLQDREEECAETTLLDFGRSLIFLHLGSDGDVNLEAFVFGVELFALVSQGAHSGLSFLNQMGSDKN